MREEFKYLVPNDKMEMLRALILPYVIRDDHIAIHLDSDYTVRSIYYDTWDLNEYDIKLAGVHSRKKLRIRGYNHHPYNNTVYIEIKYKRNMAIRKSRAPIQYSLIDQFLAGMNFSDIVIQRNDFPGAMENAINFLYYLKRKCMLPVVLVIYEREAYLFKFDHSTRVTFDKQLRCIAYPKTNSFFSDIGSVPVYHNNFILEVKSNSGFPVWMIDVISKLGVKREALSKYTLSIDTQKNQINNFNKKQVIAFSQSLSSFYNNSDYRIKY